MRKKLREADERLLGQGARLRWYVDGPAYVDEHVLVYAGGAEYHYLLGPLYSVVGLTDDAGQVVATYAYDAYGLLDDAAVVTLTDEGSLMHQLRLGLAMNLGVEEPLAIWLSPEDPANSCEGQYVPYLLDLEWGNRLLWYVDPEPFFQTPSQWMANSCGAVCMIGEGIVFDRAYRVHAERLQPYYFTGRRLDFDLRTPTTPPDAKPELALYHFRARAYDPVHGRFLQRDPAGYVDGMNLYEYARSRPLILLDPFGLLSTDEFLALARRVAKTRNCSNLEILNTGGLTRLEKRQMVRRALAVVSQSDRFGSLMATGRDSVDFWERMIKATDSPWNTAADFYENWKRLGGNEVELGDRLEEVLADKNAFLANIKKVRLFVDGIELTHDLVRADKLGTAESVDAFSDILKLGKGVAEISGAMRTLDGLGAMIDYYATATNALSKPSAIMAAQTSYPVSVYRLFL